MAIGDVRPQNSSEHQASQAPNHITPPTQYHEQHKEDEHGDEQEEPQNKDQVHDQEENIDQGGDEDDRDHEGSRTRPPHTRVCQTVQRDHPVDNILGDIKKGVTTRSRVATFCQHHSFISFLEPFKVEEALHDLDWVVAMLEELNNFKRNKVWSLIERPQLNVVGTK
jgi:site-specific DNA-cytosine methylase